MDRQHQNDPVVAEASARARTACSRQLAASDHAEEALQALARAIDAVLPGRVGHLLRCTDGSWRGYSGAADQHEGVGILSPEDLDVTLRTGRWRSSRVAADGRRSDALVVPAGPPAGQTVLVLVPGGGGLDDDAVDLVVALAAEAWATLRRIDVTRELESVVWAQREAATHFQLLDRQRADYVEGITHDLRTPVTAVLGFARTLRKAGDMLSDEERVEALEIIERQSLRMSRMLDDILDSARAEAGQLVGERRLAVPLHLAVHDAVLALGPEERPRLRADLDIDVTVCGDADQLTRVAHNLITNAVRYAPGRTPIDVRVHREGAQGLLTVRDRGPGIPAGLDVFARFGRGDVRGTGLGLYTVKRIVELHGGTISWSPTPGGGTTMIVRLPCFDPDASTPPEAPTS